MGLTWVRHCVVGSLAVALLAFLVARDGGTARAQGAKKSDSVVKVAATADKPGADGKQTVTITLDIQKPWHLYANPVGNEDFSNAQTVVTVSARTKPEEVKINYPPGKVQKDAVTGDYKIYEGKVTVTAQVRRAKGDTSPLEVSVNLQACNESSCLLPATVKVAVP